MKKKWTFYVQRTELKSGEIVDMIKVDVKGEEDFFEAAKTLYTKTKSLREVYKFDVIQAVQVEDIEEIVFTIEVE